jgi:hypothetical protein
MYPRVGTMRCGGCKELHYCSKVCQKYDWPIHKLVCKTLKDFSPENRPGNYKRAILFPQDGEQPHFFWLRYITPSDDDYPQEFGKGHDVPATSSILNAKVEEYGGVIIPTVRSIVLSRPLNNRFTIMGKVRRADTSGVVPNNEVNKSLLKVNEELQDIWYGQIIACGIKGKDNEPSRSYDIGALEFRHIVDAMRMVYDDFKVERENMVEGPSVIGVRVANAMDTFWSRRTPIERLPVKASQCTAESDIEAPICDQIGIPLVLRRLPLALTGRDRRVGLRNEVIGFATALRFLNPTIDLLGDHHGVGSAIAVRKDGKPLLAAHMLAFSDYESHMMFRHKLSTEPVDISMCSNEHFVAWYEKWLGLEKAMGKVDFDVPSPYEV